MASGKSELLPDCIQMLHGVEDILSQASAVAEDARKRMLLAQEMFNQAKEQHQKAIDEIRAAQKVKIDYLRNMKSDAEKDLEASESPSRDTETEYHDADEETSGSCQQTYSACEFEDVDSRSSKRSRSPKTERSSGSLGSEAKIGRRSNGDLELRRKAGGKNIWGQRCWR